MGAYTELMKRLQKPREWEFSAETQPKIDMPITSKIERIQPTVVGTAANGEPIWEGREMARWQMELLRFMPNIWGEFFRRWIEVKKFETNHEEFAPQQGHSDMLKTATKERIAEMRRMYPLQKRHRRYANGD